MRRARAPSGAPASRSTRHRGRSTACARWTRATPRVGRVNRVECVNGNGVERVHGRVDGAQWWWTRDRARRRTHRVDGGDVDRTRARARGTETEMERTETRETARAGRRAADGARRVVLSCVLALVSVRGTVMVVPRAHAEAAPRATASAAVRARSGAMGVVDELGALRARVRAGATTAMAKSLSTVGDALHAIELKTQEDWNVEDVWVLFAWNWLIRRGREKAFRASERMKTLLVQNYREAQFEKSFLSWVKAPMRVIQALFVVSYVFDVGCSMIDMLSTEWDIPEYIKLGFDKGSYTFSLGIIVVMAIQQYGPKLLGRFLPSIREDASLQLVITRLTSAAVVVTTLMLTLSAFGIPAKVLFSFGGLGGLAFGLAAKDFISNLIGGLVLAVMRPFKVGEKIYLTGGGGKYRDSKEKDVSNYKVAEIGWYQTKLIPKDGKVTTIPNGYFLGANVINTSREPNEWLGPQLRIALTDFEGIEALTKELRTFLSQHPDVNSAYKAPEVALKKIEVDHLMVQVEMFMHGDAYYGEKKWKEKRQAILIDIVKIVKKHCPNSPALPTDRTYAMPASSSA
ncbi:Mechanosensitive ion channel-domain-containing protein [Ostreococcus tauri]|uniref:Mechanosensitive ion channel-domain-containing protein n=2 Tax=Ostreococcus tauri TaxID=70448 RepID=A0A1Y5I8P1_OSTTA|nr:Mechanosensitive ion channel-domain-containing protein [Ostreococcus tauri]